MNEIVNPLLFIEIRNERFFEDHEPTIAKEDWVKANDILIKQNGVETWLRTFISTLSGSFRESLLAPANPYHAVTLKKPEGGIKVTADEWVQSNASLIGKVDASSWLWQLLDVLESGQNKA